MPKKNDSKLNCPLCNSDKSVLLKKGVKDDFRIKVLQCRTCSLVYLGPRKSSKEVYDFYRDEYRHAGGIIDRKQQKSLPKMGLNPERYRTVKKHLNKKTSLLEIGCSDGEFLKLIKPHAAKITGIELTKENLKKLKKIKGITVYDKPIEKLKLNEKFDVICLFAVLEHLPDIVNFMRNLRKYTHKRTKIFIQVPNFNDPLVSLYNLDEFKKFYFRKTHLYYFTPETLLSLLNKTGFKGKILQTQLYPITNHLHWIYRRQPQPDLNTALSFNIPYIKKSREPERQKDEIEELFENLDRKYRKFLASKGYSDLIWCEASLR